MDTGYQGHLQIMIGNRQKDPNQMLNLYQNQNLSLDSDIEYPANKEQAQIIQEMKPWPVGLFNQEMEVNKE